MIPPGRRESPGPPPSPIIASHLRRSSPPATGLRDHAIGEVGLDRPACVLRAAPSCRAIRWGHGPGRRWLMQGVGPRCSGSSGSGDHLSGMRRWESPLWWKPHRLPLHRGPGCWSQPSCHPNAGHPEGGALVAPGPPMVDSLGISSVSVASRSTRARLPDGPSSRGSASHSRRTLGNR